MCAKGGNSVCLAGTCSEGQPKFKKRIKMLGNKKRIRRPAQIQNVQEKNNLSR